MVDGWQWPLFGVRGSDSRAPQAGTVLTPARMADNLRSLNSKWDKESENMTTTNSELQQLCEQWKPRLGLEEWRIAVELRPTDQMAGSSGNCQIHQPTKAAIICVCPDGTFNRSSAFMRHFPETFTTEWLLVHEMLHIVLSVPFDDDPLELEQQAQEQAIETLARSLLRAYATQDG